VPTAIMVPAAASRPLNAPEAPSTGPAAIRSSAGKTEGVVEGVAAVVGGATVVVVDVVVVGGTLVVVVGGTVVVVDVVVTDVVGVVDGVEVVAAAGAAPPRVASTSDRNVPVTYE